MLNFFKVIVFVLLVISGFAGFANFGIPEINPAPPPVEAKLDLDAMTMEQFVALGDSIFNGKGTCTLCHNAVGGRAPLLDAVATRAEERLKDARYKGEAKDAAGYIYESMTKPSAFVVSGFGKSGTNDTESPMPVVSEGSIGLSEPELLAVIAFFQDKAGVDITVEIPEAAAPSEGEGEAAPKVIAKTGEEVVQKYGCGMCHKIAGQEGDMGPDLTKIGAKRSTDYLRRAVLTPDADIAAGFDGGMMPQDFGEQMATVEFEMLVKYLAGQK